MESILSNTTISKIIEGKKSKIARVDTETTVEKLVGTLTSHGILSVPVWDEVEKNYKYFVDILDVVNFIILGDATGVPTKEDMCNRIYNEARAPRIASSSIREMIKKVDSKHGRSRAIHVFEDKEPISKLLAAFSTPDIHRCIVLTQHLEYKIISQTDVIAWMISHKDQIGKSVLGKSLEQLGLKKSLHTITSDLDAIEAFREMAVRNVNAVAVVDDSNEKLIGNISASDLRGRKIEDLVVLCSPVQEFLSDKPKPIFCGLNDTLETVISKVYENKVHRVWICDSNDKPVGLATLTDIIKAVAHTEGSH